MTSPLRFPIEANDNTGKVFDGIEKRARGLGDTFDGMSGKTARPFELGAHGIQQMQFQITDLGTQLASGQSPFTAIIQQGGQIGQMFGPGASVGQALRATGTGLLTFLVNPINLAIVALAGAAAGASYLWDEMNSSDAQSAEDLLTDSAALLGDLENGYESAAEAAERYINAVQGQSSVLASLELTESEIRTGLIQAIRDLEGQAIAFQTTWLSGIVGPTPMSDQMRELVQSARDLEDSQITVEEFRDTLGGIILNPSVDDDVRQLAEELFRASEDARLLENRLLAIGAARQDVGNLVDIDTGRFGNDDLSYDQAVEQLNRGITRGRRERGIRPERQTRDRSADAAKREQEAIRKLIGDLELEKSLIKSTDAERRVAVEMRRLGATATVEQRNQVSSLILEIEREREAYELLNRVQSHFAETTFDALFSVVDGSRSASDALKDLALDFARAAAQAALLGSGPLAGTAFGAASGSGGLLGNVIGGLFAGAFADGGRIPGGQFGLVGEEGPEFISGPADITPFKGAMASGGSIAVDVRVTTDGEKIKAMVENISGQVAGQAIQASTPVIQQGAVQLARSDRSMSPANWRARR